MWYTIKGTDLIAKKSSFGKSWRSYKVITLSSVYEITDSDLEAPVIHNEVDQNDPMTKNS
jgi:hypothetical protein